VKILLQARLDAHVHDVSHRRSVMAYSLL